MIAPDRVSRRSDLNSGMPNSIQPVVSLPEPVLRLLEKVWRWGVGRARKKALAKTRSGEWPLRLSVPVISLGNITVGGTGKTPTVLALAKAWQERGGHPGILSRGYRSERGGGSEGQLSGNDEFRLLKEKLPDVPHFQHKDRFHAGQLMLAQHPQVDLILLDDGYQHRQLHRDLNILLCDALDPFGGGYCLPLGRLREPVDGVSRADHVLLTRSERCSAEWLDQVKSYFKQMHPGLPVDPAFTEIRGFRSLSGDDFPVENVGTCLAFSAIGEPDGFLHTLKSAGGTPRHEVRFPDHHHYRVRDLDSLIRQADEHHCESLVCTAKDAVKVAKLPLSESVVARIKVLEVGLDFPVEKILDRIQGNQFRRDA